MLVTFLDERLGKDDLSDSIEKFYDFENYERVDGQTINNFIANYDMKYRKNREEKYKITIRNFGLQINSEIKN